ncbi:hypothetical protein HYV80_03085 [Candidatus Woesearchaeota archaeon]|nr:hypothetical protein [Candidatus Woesearchaeota archaeon]
MAESASGETNPSRVAGIALEFPDVFRPGRRVALKINYHPQNAPAGLIDHSLSYKVFAPGFLPENAKGELIVGLEEITERIELEAGVFSKTSLKVLIYEDGHLVRMAEIPIKRRESTYFTEGYINRYLLG